MKLPAVREVIGSGDTKTSVLTATGLQVDLRIVEPQQFGAACQYFTGSKAHNIKLRQRALARGWLLNEYGLSDAETGEVIACESEDAIYRALGLAPDPAADAGRPRARSSRPRRASFRRRFASRTFAATCTCTRRCPGTARAPSRRSCARAAERGYEYLAITDHAENLAMSGVSREQLARPTGADRRAPRRATPA